MLKEGIQLFANSKSRTFLAFCFLFLISAGGATAFDFLYNYTGYFFIAINICTVAAVVVWKNKIARLAVLLGLATALGLWRGALSLPNPSDSNNIRFFAEKTTTFVGIIDAEPARSVDSASYRVKVNAIMEPGSVGEATDPFIPVHGRVQVKTKLYPEYHYGDMLKIQCRLTLPEVKADSRFHYDKYLAMHRIDALCSMPKGFDRFASASGLNIGDQDNKIKAKYFLMSRLLALKSHIQSQLDRLYTEPESSFMAGLLFGSRSGFPKDITDNFSKTGVTHIIAVSGFNITIIATTLMTVLILAGLWRQQAFWAVLVTLFLFVIFTGATASVIRAAVMGTITLVAQYIGRSSRIGNVLVFTAAVMVLMNPYVLLWDAGFQLSFLATIGLVYLSPILSLMIDRTKQEKAVEQGQRFLPRLYVGVEMTIKNGLDAISETLIQTLAAIIITLPLILYQFGRLSIVAPLVNVLILWTIPWLMLGGFVALVLSYIFYPLGQITAWCATVGLKYVLFVVEFFGKQKWSAVEFELPAWAMITLYIVIIWYVKIKSKSDVRDRRV